MAGRRIAAGGTLVLDAEGLARLRVAMLISDDLAPAGLWLAAVCLGWLFARALGAACGAWPMPELRPAVSSRWLGVAIVILLLVRIGSLAKGNILDVGQASSLGAWRVLHGLHLYGAVSWAGPGGFRIYRPDSYGPFAYYAYIPFVIIFPSAPAQVATLLPAACFDLLTLAGLRKLGYRMGGRPLGRAFMFAYLLYPFTDLTLTAGTNDALIAALCVWTIVAAHWTFGPGERSSCSSGCWSRWTLGRLGAPVLWLFPGQRPARPAVDILFGVRPSAPLWHRLQWAKRDWAA